MSDKMLSSILNNMCLAKSKKQPKPSPKLFSLPAEMFSKICRHVLESEILPTPEIGPNSPQDVIFIKSGPDSNNDPFIKNFKHQQLDMLLVNSVFYAEGSRILWFEKTFRFEDQTAILNFLAGPIDHHRSMSHFVQNARKFELIGYETHLTTLANIAGAGQFKKAVSMTSFTIIEGDWPDYCDPDSQEETVEKVDDTFIQGLFEPVDFEESFQAKFLKHKQQMFWDTCKCHDVSVDHVKNGVSGGRDVVLLN